MTNHSPAIASGSDDAEAGHPALVAALRAEIAANRGTITFARFMEVALYDPAHGYYLSAERRPGRGGDFLTAPETHPFFGITLARQIQECWQRLGRPDRFVVREYGAGVGGLAYDIIAGLSDLNPIAAAALHYEMIEPNPHRRAEAAAAMAEVGLDQMVTIADVSDDRAEAPIVGVLLANEVADALPVHRLVWRAAAGGRGGLRERYLTWRDDAAGGGRFAEAEGELSPPVVAFDPMMRLRAAAVTLHEGDAIEVSPAAATWMARVARGLRRGYLILIDYGYEATELYRDHRLAGTVRAYARHTVSDDPLRDIGYQDLTAHVDFTSLREAAEAAGLISAGLTTQAAFLTSLGLGELIVRYQDDPTTTADDYYATRAAVLRLIDPASLGRFGVLVMARDAPVTPPLRGFALLPP
ncbi:MAG: SAM-dependent methyltransferase [Chloroflexota bacterium]|nr:SAM-dependent methyltransferase [Chloroflexota bacterium]